MLKTLLKKQIMQTYATFYLSGKKGKNRSKMGIIGYLFLMIYVLGIFGFLFYNSAEMLCEPLVQTGIGWFYFVLFGMMTVCIGVVGSIFMTQSQMYHAKDNEMLLAMPIPPGILLFSRMLALFLQTFVFSGLVFVPALLVYWKTTKAGIGTVGLDLLLFFLLIILAQTFSCILGWLVALISSRLKNKNIVTVILSLIFLGIYFYLYSGMNRILNKILANSRELAVSVKEKLYPLYIMGMAGTGELRESLLFAIAVLALFGIIYWLLAKSFLMITTTNRGSAKKVYKERELSVSSVEKALFKKECCRFFGTAVYMLNCGLGSVFMLIGCGFLIIKRAYMMEMLEMIYPGMNGMLPLLALAVVCMMCTMNTITAPSVSLEGNALWNLQVLPISMKAVLISKIKLQMAITGIPALICIGTIEFIFSTSWIIRLLLPIILFLFVIFTAEIGLFFNLKHPSMNWSSETYAVKQSISVLLSMAVSAGVVCTFCLLFVLCMAKMNEIIFLLIAGIILLVLVLWLWKWLMSKGCEILRYLS